MSKIIYFFLQLVLIATSLVVTLMFTADHEWRDRYTSEDYKPKLYKGEQTLSFNKEPIMTEPPIDGIELSLVMPAYNEEKRITRTIDETITYFNKKKIKYELILVNDGSKDNTFSVMKDLMKNKYNNTDITIITYTKNSGKGFAVTTGMRYAKGKYVLMLDSDGATDIKDYEKLRAEVDKTNLDAVAIGSRNHLVENVVRTRAWYRNILMHVNNFIVRRIIGVDQKDTQCGFKLFTRSAARRIFPNMHLVRWAFDVEALYIANRMNIRIIEVPVNWSEIEGSKLNIISATISFFRDYFALIGFYTTGYWMIN